MVESECDGCRADSLGGASRLQASGNALSSTGADRSLHRRFVCHQSKLIVELDGSQHGEVAARAYDEERTAFLTSRGYRVLRFTNLDVFRNRDYVLDAIARFAAEDPHPNRAMRGSTSPRGGGQPTT